MNSFRKKISRGSDGLDWTPLEVKGSEVHPYVEYYVRNPLTGLMCRKRHKFNRFGTCQERAKMISQFIRNTEAKLANGWNPFVDGEEDLKTDTSIESVVKDFLITKQKEGKRPRTLDDYRSRTKIFKNWCSHHRISTIGQVTTAAMEEYLHYRLMTRSAKGMMIKTTTRNNDKNNLSAFFGFCVARYYIKENPCLGIKKLPEPPKERQPLTDEEKKKVVEYLTTHQRWFLLAVLMEYYTMIRPKELLSLRFSDFHLQEQVVVVPAEYSKNHKEQPVAIPDRLLNYMLELAFDYYDPKMYVFGLGCVPNLNHASVNTMAYEWSKVRNVLKIPKEVKFYSLKDSGIFDLIQSEGVIVARDQARHHDVSITNRYVTWGNQKAHEEVKRFKGKM